MSRHASISASLLVLFVALSGCGSIAYEGDDPQPGTGSSGGYAAAGTAVTVRQPSPRTVVVMPGGSAAPVAQAPSGNAIVCSGNQRLRLSEEIVTGQAGPAIYASGNCRLEILESIVQGRPAVVATGNARIRLAGCRIDGDIVTSGRAGIQTRGSRHRGRVLRGAY